MLITNMNQIATTYVLMNISSLLTRHRTEHLYTETEHVRARLDQYAPFWFWAF